MHHIRRFSNLILAAGVVAVTAGVAFDLNPTIVLVGMMMVIAGVMKIVAVAVWRGALGFGVPLHDSDPERDVAIEEGRR